MTPTGRAGVTTLLAQVPGTRALLDVGGSSFNTDVSVSSFGQPGEPQSALEGVITRFAAYWNYLTVDEVQATTVGSGAEVETRGVQINAITKSGGNQPHGEAGFGGGGGALQSDNVTDELKAQGITSGGNQVEYRYDVYGDLGGRIKRDKLWFYAAARETKEVSEVFDAAPKPDGSPAQSTQTARYFTDKITYQPSQGNRIIGFYAWSYKGNVGAISQFVPWDSRTVQHNNQDLAKGEWQMVKGKGLVMSAQYAYWGHAAPTTEKRKHRPRCGTDAGHRDPVRHRAEHPRRAVELPEHERRETQGDAVPSEHVHRRSRVQDGIQCDAHRLRPVVSDLGRPAAPELPAAFPERRRRSSSRSPTTRTTRKSCMNTSAHSSRIDGRSRAG